MAGEKLRVLFLCTGNSCRSQMAEGWARHLKGDAIEAFSAGIEAHGLNPRAVRVMAEAGVDISEQRSKLVTEFAGMDFDLVITLCDDARETCPVFPGRGRILHAGFDDPAKTQGREEDILVSFRSVRDKIRDFIPTLPDTR
ncbi:MAG: arsenate reductase ArsC [Candidatus Aquicultorales bacterium]